MTSPSNAEARPNGDATTDAFLGGRLQVTQPKCGYRAGVDPVFLAAAVPAVSGQDVLELGCGVGVASLCLAARVPGLRISGVELQPFYAALARDNATANGAPFEVIEGDIADLPPSIRTKSFDHVIANPPYFVAQGRTPASDAGRETALGEGTPLRSWIDAATRRLVSGGQLTMILRAERLGDALAGTDDRLGAVSITPLAPRIGRDATLVILSARKGARSPLHLRAPRILHEGAAHESDGDDYSAEVSAILRGGAAWPWLET